jgi:hypothetical protein
MAMCAWAQALPSERSHSNSNILKLANCNHGWVEHPKRALSPHYKKTSYFQLEFTNDNDQKLGTDWHGTCLYCGGHGRDSLKVIPAR